MGSTCPTSCSTTYDGRSGWSTTTRTCSPPRWPRTSGWLAPTATDDEVDAALREAGLEVWLDGLADGLATRLGDGAAAVSGGERARLAVARSLLADQRVLVLDEPTAHLDHATAEQLAAQVLGADGRRAVVWITHEPVGLDHVDEIVELPGAHGDEFVHPRGDRGARHTP